MSQLRRLHHDREREASDAGTLVLQLRATDNASPEQGRLPLALYEMLEGRALTMNEYEFCTRWGVTPEEAHIYAQILRSLIDTPYTYTYTYTPEKNS